MKWQEIIDKVYEQWHASSDSTYGEMLEIAREIAKKALKAGWRTYITGGFVRDMITGSKSKDLDLEFFGNGSFEEFVTFLKTLGEISEVGKSFNVIKLKVDGVDIDASWPRRERKNGVGHKGFDVVGDATMSTFEASERRDYRINSAMYDLVEDHIIDHHGCITDLQYSRLCHVSQKTFGDDPLRVLRGFQFSGRFDLTAERSTVSISRKLFSEFETLPKDRIWVEFEKWAALSIRPSRGLVFLNRTGWIKAFPELKNMLRLKQSPLHHPEGTVWQHTKMVCDKASQIAREENLSREDTVVLLLAALLHDTGKVETTEIQDDGRITAHGHHVASKKLARNFLESIGAPNKITDRVCALVRKHMCKPEKKASVRRLSVRLGDESIWMLSLLMKADILGRKTKNPSIDHINKMLLIAETMNIVEEGEKPILMGRHLIAKGLKPGKIFGVVLKEAFELQLNGDIKDLEEANKWLGNRLEEK